MDKIQRIEKIAELAVDFDLQISQLMKKHRLDDEPKEYFRVLVRYEKSEGIARLVFNEKPAPDDFIEDVKDTFTRCFPYPFSNGA